jgi:hypothetical protein
MVGRSAPPTYHLRKKPFRHASQQAHYRSLAELVATNELRLMPDFNKMEIFMEMNLQQPKQPLVQLILAIPTHQNTRAQN